MGQDWRKTLEVTGWYHDEANSGPGCAVWKRSDGRTELQVDGDLVEYMEGEVELLSRVASIMGRDNITFTTTDQPAGVSKKGATYNHAI